MQFQIPQFIEIESKLVGPLTLRQFLYLAGAGVISVISWVMFRGWLWFVMTVVAAAISIALAFGKYQGRPLPQVIFNAFGFLWKPRLYLWQKEKIPVAAPAIASSRQNLFYQISQMSSIKKLMQDLMTSKQPISKREKRLPGSFALIRKTSGDEQLVKRVNY